MARFLAGQPVGVRCLMRDVRLHCAEPIMRLLEMAKDDVRQLDILENVSSYKFHMETVSKQSYVPMDCPAGEGRPTKSGAGLATGRDAKT